MASDKILDKIAKLKRHADSAAAIGSEAEAQAFAAMFQKLLLDNKLEMTDIEFEQFEKEQPVERHWIDYKKYPDIKMKRSRVAWVEHLAQIIARAHFCRVLVHSGSSRITLVGRKDDTDVAEYMLITLQRSVEKLSYDAYAKFSVECVNECAVCHRKKNNHKHLSTDYRWLENHTFVPNWARCRGFKNSFIIAFISRLSERYEDLRRSRESQSTALVRIKTSEAALNDFIDQRKVKDASSLSTTVNFNREGVKRGKAAAEAIRLNPNVLSDADVKAIRS